MRRTPSTAVLAVLAALVAALLAGCGGSGSGSATTAAASTGAAAGGLSELAPREPTSDLPVVRLDELPEQAVETLALIAAGGPFPYAKDGATFNNRERLLPSQPTGFYREYTVIKPGEDDRGPWRIVTGDDGGRFWTEDHYASFEEVVQ